MPQTHPDKVTVLHFRLEVSLYTVNDILVFRASILRKTILFYKKEKNIYKKNLFLSLLAI